MGNETTLSDKNLIAACGMNCGICLAYLRERKPCKGCRASNENKSKSCITCIIRNCEIVNKLDSKFCFDCPKYPCTKLKQLDKRYRTKYKMSMLENLESIKIIGLEQFAKNEKDRWHCKSCGGTICVHRGFCLQCKR